jgi:hypothetical protein
MTSPNTTFTSGAILTAAQMNNLPFGVCGLQTLTTVFTTSATHTTFQDDGLTLTITEISGRRYRITALENPYPSGGLQGIQFSLIRGASTLRNWTYSAALMDAGVAYPAVLQYVYTSVGSGVATYKMQLAAATANTAVTTYGDGTFPRQFIIEDIGTA